jgi:hypothetical protein
VIPGTKAGRDGEGDGAENAEEHPCVRASANPNESGGTGKERSDDNDVI